MDKNERIENIVAKVLILTGLLLMAIILAGCNEANAPRWRMYRFEHVGPDHERPSLPRKRERHGGGGTIGPYDFANRIEGAKDDTECPTKSYAEWRVYWGESAKSLCV